MRNYAEELAYWYFRFNGFFPITDFTTTPKERKNKKGYSDTDVIAVKPPFVYEEVGLRVPKDHCSKLYSNILKENGGIYVGIICEVKAGSTQTTISDKNLKAQIRRFGFVHHKSQELKTIMKEIKKRGYYKNKRFGIYRILVHEGNANNVEWKYYMKRSIRNVLKFMLSNRLLRHKTKKEAWDKFGSSIIQLLLKHQQDFRKAYEVE